MKTTAILFVLSLGTLNACAPVSNGGARGGVSIRTDDSKILTDASALTAQSVGMSPTSAGGFVTNYPPGAPAWRFGDDYCYALHAYSPRDGELRRPGEAWIDNPSCVAQPNTLGRFIGLVSSDGNLKADLPVGGPTMLDVIAIRKNAPGANGLGVPDGVCENWEFQAQRRNGQVFARIVNRSSGVTIEEDATRSFDIRFAAGGARDQSIGMGAVITANVYPVLYRGTFYPRYGECNSIPNPLNITSPALTAAGSEWVAQTRTLDTQTIEGSCAGVSSDATIVARYSPGSGQAEQASTATCGANGNFSIAVMLSKANATDRDQFVPVSFFVKDAAGNETFAQTIKLRQHFCAGTHVNAVPPNFGGIGQLIPEGKYFANVSLTTNRDIVAGGDTGTDEDPIRICTIEQLHHISRVDPVTLSFKLMDDIDASATAVWDAGRGFLPILYTATEPAAGGGRGRFRGKLFGNGKRIRNLVINRGADRNVGLFSRIGHRAEVSDLIFRNPNITGYTKVGVLAGSASRAVVRNVAVIGDGVSATTEVAATSVETVTTASADWPNAGGLIGSVSLNSKNAGAPCADDPSVAANPPLDTLDILDSTLVGVRVTTPIAATTGSAGGLVGFFFSPVVGADCITSPCSVSAVINIRSSSFLNGEVVAGTVAGGLIGKVWNGSGVTIERSDVTGSVLSYGAYAGGLVGQFGNSSITPSKTRPNVILDSSFDSRPASSVSATAFVGGLVGNINTNNGVYSSFSITTSYSAGVAKATVATGAPEIGGLVAGAVPALLVSTGNFSLLNFQVNAGVSHSQAYRLLKRPTSGAQGGLNIYIRGTFCKTGSADSIDCAYAIELGASTFSTTFYSVKYNSNAPYVSILGAEGIYGQMPTDAQFYSDTLATLQNHGWSISSDTSPSGNSTWVMLSGHDLPRLRSTISSSTAATGVTPDGGPTGASGNPNSN